MADLLECLIQLKALRESVARLEALTCAADRGAAGMPERARAAADSMARAEQQWQAILAAVLPSAGFGAATEPASVASPARRFADLRVATLAVLDRCSADDLAAEGAIEGRGPVRVADVVAHMLAHDSEQLGTLRRDVVLRASPGLTRLPPAT